MPRSEIAVVSIGLTAQNLLAQEQEARVMGVTSRGVFLHLETDWVIFLSDEAFRGPLTLNLQPGWRTRSTLRPGMPAKTFPGEIFFPTTELAVSTRLTAPWQAPPRQKALPAAQRKALLAECARQLPGEKKSQPLEALFSTSLGDKKAPAAAGNPFLPHMRCLQEALRQGDSEPIAGCIQAILGLGAGLTPAGDDVTLGFMLALNRWEAVLAKRLNIETLNARVLALAYQKTTTLSANLIECASQGQGDERLLLALDSIITGEPPANLCAAHLAAWGNSSGLDALAGMALVLGQ